MSRPIAPDGTIRRFVAAALALPVVPAANATPPTPTDSAATQNTRSSVDRLRTPLMPTSIV